MISLKFYWHLLYLPSLLNFFPFAVVPVYPDLYEASIHELQFGLEKEHFTSVDLVKAYLARIEEVNLKGATLRAVLEINPSAISDAAALDRERRLKGSRGPLHGIPVLIKDSIAVEGLNNTAGSFALLGSIVNDSTVASKFREAGTVFLGKTNLDEFSHFKAEPLPLGWSAIGGQSTNPYYPRGNPAGSSSGSAIATAIGLTAFTLGGETDSSIVYPAAWNNDVGIKPTVGLVSRKGVVPISPNLDSIGPITRSVTDAAIVLNVIAGTDPLDSYTLSQPSRLPDYTQALKKNGLHGKRVGVPRNAFLNERFVYIDDAVRDAFEDALDIIQALGATLVDPADLPSAEDIYNTTNEEFMAEVDFKIAINEYLAELKDIPTGVRRLTDIIAFNNANPEKELFPPYNDQSRLTSAESRNGKDEVYWAAVANNHDLGRTRGIDAVLKEYSLDALVLPTLGFSSTPAAIAGYPIVTVPLGFYPDNVTIKSVGPDTFYPAPGLPFGLSFFGTAYSEFQLIGMAYGFEQATHVRMMRMAYEAAIPKTQLKDIVSFHRRFQYMLKELINSFKRLSV
ncbi:hypothetical protein M422DRAFT_183207 [Sphaerobolus stellatus SS14]|uniref:Amidase domain-containing protein n=1 Tax=Sphaerobolus stellatus (strain SS14) TaxID=990650 RepID=A0A0C9UFJ5_SPHS4|nr:hypothetical protein M422DRAFT_183207 [Sphaerobolus stellatus SS14]